MGSRFCVHILWRFRHHMLFLSDFSLPDATYLSSFLQPSFRTSFFQFAKNIPSFDGLECTRIIKEQYSDHNARTRIWGLQNRSYLGENLIRCVLLLLCKQIAIGLRISGCLQIVIWERGVSCVFKCVIWCVKCIIWCVFKCFISTQMKPKCFKVPHINKW